MTAWIDHDRLLGLETEHAAPCPACMRHAQLLQSDRRLLRPLRPRSGRRAVASGGTAVFDGCTWQEAVETAVLAMRQAQSPDHALLWLSGGAASVLDLLPRRIGRLTRHCVHVERRQPAQTIARLAALHAAETLVPEHDLSVLWGAAYVARRDSNAARIVVDPRAGAWGTDALHLALRPGADGTLAAAWGERFMSPDRAVADIAGVNATALDKACRCVREARAPLFVLGPGLGRYPQAAWSVNSIAALARNVGARLLAPSVHQDVCAQAALPLGGTYRVVGSGAVNAALESLVPRQTVVVIEGGDPLTIPGASDTLRRFLRQSSRVIQFAYQHDATTAFADLVVPVLSPWERNERGRAPVSPPRDLIDETRFWRRVARAVEWPESWFPAEPEPRHEPSGAPYYPPIEPGIKELGASLRETGEGPSATPELFAAYRLWLVPGSADPCLGWDSSVSPVAGVVLAPADGQRRGVADGTIAVVHNPRGTLRARVRWSEAQPSGVASIDPRDRFEAQVAALAPPAGPGPWEGETWGTFLVEVSPP